MSEHENEAHADASAPTTKGAHECAAAEYVNLAAQVLRTRKPSTSCACPGEEDSWFDRSYCPEPCGSSHYVCVRCCRITGHCPVFEAGRDPLSLTIADILEDALTWHAFASLGTAGPCPLTQSRYLDLAANATGVPAAVDRWKARGLLCRS